MLARIQIVVLPFVLDDYVSQQAFASCYYQTMWCSLLWEELKGKEDTILIACPYGQPGTRGSEGM